MFAPSTFTITGVHTMTHKNLFTTSKIYYIQVRTIPQVFSVKEQVWLGKKFWFTITIGGFLYTRYELRSTACVFVSEIKL